MRRITHSLLALSLLSCVALLAGCSTQPSPNQAALTPTVAPAAPPKVRVDVNAGVSKEALEFLNTRDPISTTLTVKTGEVHVEVTGHLLSKDGSKNDPPKRGHEEFTIAAGGTLKLSVDGKTRFLLTGTSTGTIEVTGLGSHGAKTGTLEFEAREHSKEEPGVDIIEVEGQGNALIDGYGKFAARNISCAICAHRTELTAIDCGLARAQDQAWLSAENCDAAKLLHHSRGVKISKCKLVEVMDESHATLIEDCEKVLVLHAGTAKVKNSPVDAQDSASCDASFTEGHKGAVVFRDAATGKANSADSVTVSGKCVVTLNACAKVVADQNAAINVTSCPDVTAASTVFVKTDKESKVKQPEKK